MNERLKGSLEIQDSKCDIQTTKFNSRNIEFKKFRDSLSKLTSQIIHINLSVFATLNYFGHAWLVRE